jgi:hypothetical protein
LSEFVGDTLSFIAPDKKEEAKDEKKLKAPHAWHLVVVNRGGAANIYACMHINSKYKFKKVNNVRENLPPTTTNQNKKIARAQKYLEHLVREMSLTSTCLAGSHATFFICRYKIVY